MQGYPLYILASYFPSQLHRFLEGVVGWSVKGVMYISFKFVYS